ncbi:unnamed protein product, partial [marine sediment metagenome]
MYKYEKDHFNDFSSIITVSDLDKQLVKNLSGHNNVFVVENGVDVSYFKPLETTKINCVIFSASMDAFSNQNAVHYFMDKIFPLIKRELSDVKFYIVGRNPNNSIRNLAKRKDVIVTGTVDDVRPFIAKAYVNVVPLQVGGGTRLKILEAMSMGIPVVSTPVGAEGLKVKHYENILIADSE